MRPWITIRFFFSCLLLGLNLSGAGTSLHMGKEDLILRHETEPFHYYSIIATSDVRSWSPLRMPEFLGMGGKVEIPLRYREAVSSGMDFFAYVVEAGEIPPFDPDNGRPVREIFYAPIHPPELLKLGIEGTVTLEFVIDAEGRVRDPFVHATTDARFNEAALEAVRLWTFLPARENGVPFASRARLPVSFSIEAGGIPTTGIADPPFSPPR
jgi:TonB family protein